MFSKKTLKGKMGKETWARNLSKDISPGPGDYEIRAESRSPRYTIRPRHEKGNPQEPQNRPSTCSPSPNYTPPNFGAKYTSRTNGTINRSPRRFESVEKTPGPDYNPPKFGSKFTDRSFPTISMPLDPAAPCKRRYPEEPSYSHTLDGPAQFSIVKYPNFKRAPTYVIGHRGQCEWMLSNDFPSPAQYFPNFQYVESSNPAYSISLLPHKTVPEPSPSPADHPSPDTFGKGQIAIRHSRYNRRSTEPQTPGPGSYNISPRSSSPSYTIRPYYHSVTAKKIPTEYISTPRLFDKKQGGYLGNGRSYTQHPPDSPGPAYYYPKKADLSARAYTISKKDYTSQNSRAHHERETPGPGEYNPVNPLHAKSPGIQLKGERLEISNEKTPSPDDYNPSLNGTHPNSPSYSIKNKYRNETDSPTKNAGYVVLPTERGIYPSIHLKDTHSLIPE